MTTHARQQIREAVATALTGLTTTGTRVYQSRMLPTDALPCLLIETNGEEIERMGGLGATQQRRLQIAVRGFAKASANVDDTLDAIALEVETALETAGTLGSKIKGYINLDAVETEFDELEKPVGVVSLRYSAIYVTQAGSPGVIL
jgi:hypothetical protein